VTSQTLKHSAYQEMKEGLVIALYLWLIFALMTIHKAMILAEHHIEFAAHGIALFNALALAKVMLVARKIRFFDRLNEAPLIYPTLLKSAAFSVVLACFKIVEEAALGWYHGETFNESIAEIGGGTWKGILSMTALVGVLLIPFFGYTELARVLGPGKLGRVFFRPRHLLNLPKDYFNASLNDS
jgi:hypothetical protein